MPIVNQKYQVTLPKDMCRRLELGPGDEISIFEHRGHVTLIKMNEGASAGALQHIKPDTRYSDEESRQHSLAVKNQTPRRKKSVP